MKPFVKDRSLQNFPSQEWRAKLSPASAQGRDGGAQVCFSGGDWQHLLFSFPSG